MSLTERASSPEGKGLEPLPPARVLASNIAATRTNRQWNRKVLADRVNRYLPGEGRWTHNTVADIEGARRRIRRVDANELVALARACNTTVMALLVPPEGSAVLVGEFVYSREDYVQLVFQPPPINHAKLEAEAEEQFERLEGLRVLRAGGNPEVEADWILHPWMIASLISGDPKLLALRIEQAKRDWEKFWEQKARERRLEEDS